VKRYSWRTGALEIVMLVIALIFLIPIYILINLAIRPATDLSSPLRPTTDPTFANFGDAWDQSGMGGAITNSIIVTVVSVVLIVALSAMAAYPLARFTAKWSTASFYLFMVGLLLPFQLGLIPLYSTMKDLNLIGGIIPLIIIDVGLRIPFSIFLYVQFLRGIPVDYEEAAAIDGANQFQIFRRIVFPMLKPITGTVIILNGLFIWNDFLQPLLYLSGTNNRTVPVAIYSFVGEFTSQWGIIFSALIMGVIPILIAFFFLQKSLIKSMASGIKG
jgi:raffinose/stachyose/melibiose transport system permease protein